MIQNRYLKSSSFFCLDPCLFIVLIPVTTAKLDAGSPHEKALAAVAVSLAQVQVANDRPRLPQSDKQFSDLLFRDSRFSRDTNTNSVIDPAAVGLQNHSSAPVLSEHTNGGGRILEPMWIEVASPTRSEVPRTAVVTFYTGERVYGKAWCAHCPEVKARYGDGSDRVRIEYSDDVAPGDQIYPALRFIGENGDIRFPADKRGHYWIPDSLDELADIVQRHSPAINQNLMESRGSAGTIHASVQVDNAIVQWRSHIGESRLLKFKWDRTGNPSFHLLSGGDWSAKAVFGEAGRIEGGVSDPANLPVDRISANYRIVGPDVILDPEPISFPGLAAKLGPTSATESASSTVTPIGIIDPLTTYSIFCMLRDLMQILWPVVDLNLGGCVRGDAMLSNNTITVNFHDQECPVIRIVMLFHFNLAVKTVEITRERVRIIFTGSRFIRERTFEVR